MTATISQPDDKPYSATDDQIRRLRAESATDTELVEVCDIALGDKPAPFGPGLETIERCRAECARTLDYAAQEARGELVRVPAGGRTQTEVDALYEASVDAMIANEAYWRSR